jgi:hypothetical protein
MTKKLSKIEKRIQKQQEKLLTHLAESGNISYSCKRAGISRETYYRWRENEEFVLNAEASINNGKEFVNDLAHTKLMQSINEGHFPAVRFQLMNCHEDYLPKKSVQPFRLENQLLQLPISEVPERAKLEEYRKFLMGESGAS